MELCQGGNSRTNPTANLVQFRTRTMCQGPRRPLGRVRPQVSKDWTHHNPTGPHADLPGPSGLKGLDPPTGPHADLPGPSGLKRLDPPTGPHSDLPGPSGPQGLDPPTGPHSDLPGPSDLNAQKITLGGWWVQQFWLHPLDPPLASFEPHLSSLVWFPPPSRVTCQHGSKTTT